MVFRRNKVDAATEAYEKLSDPTKAIVSENLAAWKALVREVGPQLAIEHAETASMMGITDAYTTAVAFVVASYQAEESTWNDTVDDLGALFGKFWDRAMVIQKAISTGQTSDESRLVAYVAVRFLGSTLGMANAAVDDESAEEVDPTEPPWEVHQLVWEKACADWDAKSGRPSLPLVGDARP